MPLVTAPVIGALTGTGASSASGSTPFGHFSTIGSFDYSIGGIPFMSAVSNDFPYVEETADYRKPQVDQARDVGEQSLLYWWLKSQSGFHGGAGQRYLDTVLVSEPYQAIRFDTSSGVDVFSTPGSASLLHDTSQFLSSGNTNVRVGTTPYGFVYADGTTFKHVVGGTTYTVAAGNSHSILSIAVSGTTYYVADDTGVYSGTLSGAGGSAGALLWNTGASVVILSWVKSRLMAVIGSKVYELAGTGPGLPTQKFTAPSTFVPTAFAESPSAIYLGGYDPARGGTVYKFVLDGTGAVPTLSGAIVTAELPSDEPVYALRGVLGSYLAIGTAKGVRIALIDTNGDLTYGPNLMQYEGRSVVSCHAQDRYVYCLGADPQGVLNQKLFVVDLGQQVAFGRFAYSSHLSFATLTGLTGSVSRDASTGRMVVSNGSKIYQESTAYVASGSLTTSRIRFGTLEPKLVKYFGYETDGGQGTVSIAFTTEPGTVQSVGPLQTGGVLGVQSVAVNASPVEVIQATITLTASSTVAAPALRAYQIKALPAQKRQRQYQVPLRCFDSEKDRNGQRIGGDGAGLARLVALESLEEGGDAVVFQLFTKSGTVTRSVVIDKLQFVQRNSVEKQSQLGGVIIATLRAID